MGFGKIESSLHGLTSSKPSPRAHEDTSASAAGRGQAGSEVRSDSIKPGEVDGFFQHATMPMSGPARRHAIDSAAPSHTRAVDGWQADTRQFLARARAEDALTRFDAISAEHEALQTKLGTKYDRLVDPATGRLSILESKRASLETAVRNATSPAQSAIVEKQLAGIHDEIARANRKRSDIANAMNELELAQTELWARRLARRPSETAEQTVHNHKTFMAAHDLEETLGRSLTSTELRDVSHRVANQSRLEEADYRTARDEVERKTGGELSEWEFINLKSKRDFAKFKRENEYDTAIAKAAAEHDGELSPERISAIKTAVDTKEFRRFKVIEGTNRIKTKLLKLGNVDLRALEAEKSRLLGRELTKPEKIELRDNAARGVRIDFERKAAENPKEPDAWQRLQDETSREIASLSDPGARLE